MAKEKRKGTVLRTQADVAWDFSVSIETVKGWAKQGMPGASGSYVARDISGWLRSVGPWRQHLKTPLDPDEALLAADSDSPALERLRLAKAKIAELEYAQLEGTLLSREKAIATLGRWASIIRRLGERLGKRYGPEATIALNESLVECEHVVHEFDCDTTTN